MKTKIPLYLVLAATLSGSSVRAQNPPQPPPPPGHGPFGAGHHGHGDAPEPSRPPHPAAPPHPPAPLRPSGPPQPGTPGLPQLPLGPQPFLGVITDPVPPAVSAQLGLPEGFGLLVNEVLPNSPAAAAGIQRHDILKLLNDQQLVDPNQLAVLVKAAGKDNEVALTVIRKGQEQKLNAKIGERVLPVRKRFEGLFRPGAPMDHKGLLEHSRRMEEHSRRMQNNVREHQEQVRRQKDEVREMKERLHKHPHLTEAVPPADILREARPGGGGQIKSFSDTSVSTVDGAKARLHLKDQDGEIEVSVDGGKRNLTAKDAAGTVVFSGPIDTEEERAKVPEQFRQKLDKIKIRQQIEEQTAPHSPDAFLGAQVEVSGEFEDNVQ